MRLSPPQTAGDEVDVLMVLLNQRVFEVMSTNWADYLNLVYSVPFWEARKGMQSSTFCILGAKSRFLFQTGGTLDYRLKQQSLVLSKKKREIGKKTWPGIATKKAQNVCLTIGHTRPSKTDVPPILYVPTLLV